MTRWASAERHDEAVVVVGVLADQVDPPGACPDAGGIVAVLLGESPSNQLDVLGAHMGTPATNHAGGDGAALGLGKITTVPVEVMP